jgi:type II secretory pathway pseudopilin PulG
MKFATATTKRRASAFTLVEVLAAMLFMAIVIPVAVDALHIASLAGEVASRKAAAARIADRVLNENVAAAGNGSATDGTVIESGHEFRWTVRTDLWPADSALQLLTAEVSFSAGSKPCVVRLSTLISSTPTVAGQ